MHYCVLVRRKLVLCHVDKTRSRAVSLPAALSAAGALTAANLDYGVTEFAAGVVEAGVYLFVYDDAAAETGAEGDHEGVVAALGGTHFSLALSRRIRVVLNEYILYTRKLCELCGDGVVEEGKIVCVYDITAVVVGCAGSCDSGVLNVAD